jgi:hypothetical protein
MKGRTLHGVTLRDIGIDSLPGTGFLHTVYR